MKKGIKLFLPCILLLGLSACGSSSGDTSKEGSEAMQVTTNKEITSEEQKEKIQLFDSSLIPNVYNFASIDFYINAPNYHPTEEAGYTEKYEEWQKKYVTITGSKCLKATSCKEAYEVCKPMFLRSIENHHPTEMKIEHDEPVNINGIEMYKFEGNLAHELDGDKWEQYMIGYAFQIDGYAMQITGSVNDRAQPQESIDEIRNVVNEMAKSVRTTP